MPGLAAGTGSAPPGPRTSERARAKVNLTLRVLGRRPDGYHALESLVSFAGVGDEVALQPGGIVGVDVAGPFATQIEGENLLHKALRALRHADAGLALGRVHLVKNLPVAAGLGGGSADAAALLRLVQQANPEASTRIDWMARAADLGADVPVCLANTPALMWGVGERLAKLAPGTSEPAMPAVLVNPGLPLATRDVFQALAAQPLPPGAGQSPPAPAPFATVDEVAGYMRAVGNDLEPPALRLLPAIGTVKAALARCEGCLAVALSGSGPTCFALFASTRAAERAAARLAQVEPGWWVKATTIDFPASR